MILIWCADLISFTMPCIWVYGTLPKLSFALFRLPRGRVKFLKALLASLFTWSKQKWLF